MVNHVLRYDDLSATSCEDVERPLVELLRKHRAPCTFAAIPFSCDPASIIGGGRIELRSFPQAKAELLRPLLKDGLAEVALHGYAHLATSSRRGLEEFSDAMPADVQRELIRVGKAHLEDVFQTSIRVFVPPWNRCSVTALDVLRNSGLLFSGGFCRDNVNVDSLSRNVPCVLPPAETLSALRKAVRRKPGSRPAIAGTIIHDYDFAESGYKRSTLTMKQFDRHLASWSQVADVERMLISQAAEQHGDDRERIRSNELFHEKAIRSRIGRRFLRQTRQIYWSQSTAISLTRLARWLP
jgi:peptidoglycan/xylan/chitin deacetylase (PgdA/CDA1 family)